LVHRSGAGLVGAVLLIFPDLITVPVET